MLYPFEYLLKTDKKSFKDIIAEYFSVVYFVYYKENGILPRGLYDPEPLQRLGLPPESTGSDIKSKSRELVKKNHPDYGGDRERFIELMKTYRKLTDGNK